jgi:hypothetical protein
MALEDDGYHHRIDGIDPQLLDNAPLGPASPLPYFLGLGRSLARDVAKGEIITGDAIARPEGSVLWALREEQDRLAAAGWPANPSTPGP